MMTLKNDYIYSTDSRVRHVPYTVLFDMLTYFDDNELNQRIHFLLSNGLPKNADYENSIDLWVDLESSGEITVIYSKLLAKAISDYLKNVHKKKLQIAVKHSHRLSPENNHFIFYLKKFIPEHQLGINIENVGDDVYCKGDDARYLRWDSLAGCAGFHPERDVQTLVKYAWRCAELGAETTGFNLLAYAMDHVQNNDLKDFYYIQKQFMSIATQHYLQAAEAKNVLCSQSKELLDAFHLTKAWGNVLSRRIDEAAHHFKMAGVSMQHLPTDLYSLYRMNIFALLHYLSGHPDNALTIEKEIEKAVHASSDKKQQITYINSINLARLYRSIDDFDNSKKYYDKAFETTYGIRTETDFVYSNVCYAMLFEKQGLYKQALVYWTKAAMHWLVTETKEALGWRAIRAIYQSSFLPRSPLNVSDITNAFISKLQFLVKKENMVSPFQMAEHIQFLRYDVHTDVQHSHAFFAHELSFLVRYHAGVLEHHDNEETVLLKKAIIQVLSSLTKLDHTQVNEIIVDRSDGIDVPSDWKSFLRSCTLLPVNKISVDSQCYHMTDEQMARLESHLIIKKSPAIHDISKQNDHYCVNHYRYKVPKIISDDLYALLEYVNDEKNLLEVKNKFNMSNRQFLNVMQDGLVSIFFNELPDLE